MLLDCTNSCGMWTGKLQKMCIARGAGIATGISTGELCSEATWLAEGARTGYAIQFVLRERGMPETPNTALGALSWEEGVCWRGGGAGVRDDAAGECEAGRQA